MNRVFYGWIITEKDGKHIAERRGEKIIADEYDDLILEIAVRSKREMMEEKND